MIVEWSCCVFLKAVVFADALLLCYSRSKCCMIISTRGFHLQSTSSEDDTQQLLLQDYSGPFLLPFIDLLNHDPQKACTVLRRDESSGAFIMMAERDIARGEPVFHSYGHDLTSAQVLQTFGFVPNESIQRATRWNTATGLTTNDTHTNDTATAMAGVTVAMLSRDDILKACIQMMTSEYPLQVETHVKMNPAEYQEETWKVSSITLPEKREIDFVSDNLVVEYSESPLSNEVVTLCTLLLLPDSLYEEFMSDSPTLVDASVLQDYFLGKLVCKSLLLAIDEKLKTYGSNSLCEDVDKLRLLYDDKNEKTRTEMRAMYGLTIRIEERACLQKLLAQVSKLMAALDNNDDNESNNDESNDGDTNGNGKRKRAPSIDG